MPEIAIEPNEKYWRVIDPYQHPENDTVDWEEWPDEHKEAADAYLETIDGAPTMDDLRGECTCGPNEACSECPPDEGEPGEVPTLSWDDISVPKDPDLVAYMATYFDGMWPYEPTDLIRAKLRLLDVEKCANAQIASRAELRAN